MGLLGNEHRPWNPEAPPEEAAVALGVESLDGESAIGYSIEGSGPVVAIEFESAAVFASCMKCDDQIRKQCEKYGCQAARLGR